MGDSIRPGRTTVGDDWYRWMVQSIEGYAVFSVSLDNLITTWNRGAERVFGYRREDVLGENARFIFTPEDIQRKIPETEMAEAATYRAALDERWHVKKDGTIFFASGLMMQVRNDEGQQVGFVKVVRESTPAR